MIEFKIANVLLEDTRQFRATPLLYVRSDGAVVPCADGWKMQGTGGTGAFDFTTFFNGLSVMKYNRYTSAKGYRLHLHLKGASCTIKITHADRFDYYPSVLMEMNVAESSNWHEVEIDLPNCDGDVLEGFQIHSTGDVYLKDSFYTALVEEEELRTVELALSTTTFKKERFIEHNIELVRKQILGCDDEVATHFRMFVIDNGRTLDSQQLSGDGISVYPNRNVGGSGGFAYGMLLAQKQEGVTHVLLMDDDVEVSPESIKRTYSLLRIVNDEYSEAFVSGAMMNFDEPDIHWEDIGYMTEAGVYQSLKPVLRMSNLHDCVTSESFEPDYRTWPDLKQRYAAWWYCCIPVSVIRKHGMPLPFFVRFDDAEYGLRCNPHIMTLNGICIWHLAFYMRYNAGVERYQTIRNGITGQAITGVAPLTNFVKEIERNIRIELVKFNYKDALLAVQGFEDFLNGPSSFMSKDYAEKRFMEANRNKEVQVSLNKLKPVVENEVGIDIDTIGTDEILRDISLDKVSRNKLNKLLLLKRFNDTLNGQVKGGLRPLSDRVAVVEGVGWSCPIGKLYGADFVIAINIQQKTGVLRRRDNSRGREIWHRFENDLKYFEANRDSIYGKYSSIKQTVTSTDFWETYLDF
ncbi:glycosyltransferase family 2 protein [Olsenella umbonata]|uniref:Glycosyltransferase family 2 protein n=1 Tax=Parafannyhessea umbonata TaxID=604330 RepID=A0A7X9TCW5_9ACTN|nr:glycosyltransferase [Parafannyhessea umbonata]NMF26646.1 glycosyltransferase family 2 protein [Parafannyhessea umbonata]